MNAELDTVIAWPAILTPEDEGGFTVSFADWPEALTHAALRALGVAPGLIVHRA